MHSATAAPSAATSASRPDGFAPAPSLPATTEQPLDTQARYAALLEARLLSHLDGILSSFYALNSWGHHAYANGYLPSAEATAKLLRISREARRLELQLPSPS